MVICYCSAQHQVIAVAWCGPVPRFNFQDNCSPNGMLRLKCIGRPLSLRKSEIRIPGLPVTLMLDDSLLSRGSLPHLTCWELMWFHATLSFTVLFSRPASPCIGSRWLCVWLFCYICASKMLKSIYNLLSSLKAYTIANLKEVWIWFAFEGQSDWWHTFSHPRISLDVLQNQCEKCLRSLSYCALSLTAVPFVQRLLEPPHITPFGTVITHNYHWV